MLKPSSIARFHLVMVLSTLLLVIYYGLVYRPLVKQAAALDAPLTNIWLKLSTAPVNPTPTGPDLGSIHRNYQSARNSLEALHRAGRTTSARLALDAETRRRINEPFQLLDYRNERQNRVADLERLARQQEVIIERSVFDAFPEYTAEVQKPELLWAQLEAAHQLLSTAVHCKVRAVSRMQLSAIPTPAPFETEETTLQELSVRVELVGSMAAVGQLLSSLPRRADELKALGLPGPLTNKAPLLVRGLLLRKNSAEKPDEVSLDLRAAGLVYLE